MKNIFIGIITGLLFFFLLIFTFTFLDGRYKNYNDNIYNVNGDYEIVDDDEPDSYKYAHFDFERLVKDLSRQGTALNKLVTPNDLIDVLNWFNRDIWGHSAVGVIQGSLEGKKPSTWDIVSSVVNVTTGGIYDALVVPLGLISVVGTFAIFVLDTAVSYLQIFLNIVDDGYVTFNYY